MTKKPSILIFECANAHGGDFNLLKSTITQFKDIDYPNKHIKFQPFHSDTIALSDFSWHPIYQELLFRKDQWALLINNAASSFDGVWLDIFDRYGTDVLSENINNVFGIKLQASVLENIEIFTALQALNLSDKTLMLNISGYDISDIEQFIDSFSRLNIAELILQLGHQAYPTEIKDTGLQKIKILRAAFPHLNICIADHASAQDDLACIIPLLGIAAGCSLVEKHICLERATAKYDHFSALEPLEMQILANRLATCPVIFNGTFISMSERQYLEKSIQAPVAAKPLTAGTMISASDLIYRRTNQAGNNLRELFGAQQRRWILGESVDVNTTIKLSQLRPARIGVIVACRMKSSRLKNKATLPIAGLASVERCLENCLKISGAEIVVLATSSLEEDSILENYTLGGQVKLWRGDPDDVIQRYLGACDAYGIDVIVRVTADCPVVSPEIAEVLLDHHFRKGADYTAAKQCAVGTSCEIYNTEALRRIISYLGKAEYSEYMTWYLQNNKHIFKTEIIDLPSEMVRDYRLTLDYPEDLELFERLYVELAERNLPLDLQRTFEILDQHPDIATLNSHLSLGYKVDKILIDKLNRVTKINVRI
jgi:N,N'-diacetyllegionaminate synthase